MSISDQNETEPLKPATQTQTLSKERKNGKLFIGIPKEITFQENRVPLTPSAIQFLTGLGHIIVMEKGAGANANFSDLQYSDAGAEMVSSPKQVYEADIVLKVAPPTIKEVNLLQSGQILISVQ